MKDWIYTTDYSAYQYLLNNGYVDGGILGYVHPTTGTPLYRFYNSTWGHFFTTNYSEGAAMASFEFTACYVFGGGGVRQVRRWHHITHGCYRFTGDDMGGFDNTDFTDEGLKFRIEATQITGTVPLYCAHHAM